MQFTDYLKCVVDYGRKHSTQRLGQVYFNTLQEVRPELAHLAAGKPYDCFYNDFLVEDFLVWVESRWNDS